MVETLISFLGGSAFRMLWGEVSSAWTRYQDHKHELAMLTMQGRLDAQRHSQQVEMVRLQAEAGVQIVRVQGEADVARAEADAFVEAVKATAKSYGIWWVDAWNGAIRPALATAAMLVVIGNFVASGFVLEENTWALVSAILGVYVADRALAKRGK